MLEQAIAFYTEAVEELRHTKDKLTWTAINGKRLTDLYRFIIDLIGDAEDERVSYLRSIHRVAVFTTEEDHEQ